MGPHRTSDGFVLSRPACARVDDVVMAVPKKRQSKMKTRQRKANWFAKARRSAQLALSRAKSAKYKPLEDPKYAFDAVDEDEEEEEEYFGMPVGDYTHVPFQRPSSAEPRVACLCLYMKRVWHA